jgi:hypothetical protein
MAVELLCEWMAGAGCFSFLLSKSYRWDCLMLLDAARTALLHSSRLVGEKSAKTGAAGSLIPESKLHA